MKIFDRRLRSFFLLIFWQNVLAQATEEKSYMPLGCLLGLSFAQVKGD